MQGLSASIPLVLNTPNHFLEAEIGLIGLDQTIFSWWSISIVVAIMIILPQVMRRLAPHDEHVVEIRPPIAKEPVPDTGTTTSSVVTPSQKMENARWITLSLAFLGGVYVVRFFLGGGELQLDSLNMIFVVLGLAFADSPKHYIELLGNAAKVANTVSPTTAGRCCEPGSIGADGICRTDCIRKPCCIDFLGSWIGLAGRAITHHRQ